MPDRAEGRYTIRTSLFAGIGRLSANAIRVLDGTSLCQVGHTVREVTVLLA